MFPLWVGFKIVILDWTAPKSRGGGGGEKKRANMERKIEFDLQAKTEPNSRKAARPGVPAAPPRRGAFLRSRQRSPGVCKAQEVETCPALLSANDASPRAALGWSIANAVSQLRACWSNLKRFTLEKPLGNPGATRQKFVQPRLCLFRVCAASLGRLLESEEAAASPHQSPPPVCIPSSLGKLLEDGLQLRSPRSCAAGICSGRNGGAGGGGGVLPARNDTRLLRLTCPFLSRVNLPFLSLRARSGLPALYG